MVTTLSGENCKTKKIDTHTYKSFSSKKVSKSHFLAENNVYIFNIQNLIANETSLKMKGEVSSKYHKSRRSIIKIGLGARKICRNVFKISMKKDKILMLMGNRKKIKYSCSWQ